MKEIVYKRPVNTKDELRARVEQAMEEFDPTEIQKATSNHVMESLQECLRVNGQHFKQFSY